MAKKNLAALMSGIMGEPEMSKSRQEPEIKVAEPVKQAATAENNETRATFIVRSEQLRKLKHIAIAEGKLNKDILAEALEMYLTQWENTHGSINIPKI